LSALSKIEWTDATWNPVVGCSKVSPGCKGCYAIKEVHRMAGNPNPKIRAANEGLTVIEGGHPNWTGKVRLIPERLEIPLRRRKPTRYFVNSLSDLFHQDLSFEEIRQVHFAMLRAHWHTYQILTKRSDRMAEYFRWWFGTDGELAQPAEWIWLGVSVESRDYLSRIDHLRKTPAAVRFLSLEPLLEDLGQLDLSGIDWVIVGGESGPGARPMHPEWVRSIRDQCVAAGAPFFFKQWGEWRPAVLMDGDGDYQYFRDGQGTRKVGKKAAGRLLDGRTWDEMPRRVVKS
jgi:protein gp37